MAARKVILDCDPGQDDAINQLLAMSSPDDLEILGITAVAGNVPLPLTQRNARLICDIGARPDLRVFAGREEPLQRPLVTAEYVHGANGIDGIDIYEPDHPLQEQHAVDFIVETLSAAKAGSVTLVPTGPLTNIASALQKAPDIAQSIESIVLMGGAMREGGNCTPSAEFNIYVDPQAAKIVFDCGRPIIALGLDVTHKVLATSARVDRIRALDNRAASATVGMLDFFNRYDTAKYGSLGSPLHDPCTCAYLLAPELFTEKSCNISVEVDSELTMGHTAVDYWNVTDKAHNAMWVHDVDADQFFGLLTERLARFTG